MKRIYTPGSHCGAHCRTTGEPCKNFVMPNGRCRMHGGASTGRPIQHGYYTAEAERSRRDLALQVDQLRQLIHKAENKLLAPIQY